MSFPIAPKIEKALETIKIYHKKSFSFLIRDGFSPHDGSLHFELTHTNATPWLHIDSELGEVYGICPQYESDKFFKLTIYAINYSGSVSQSFILHIVCTDIEAEVTQTLEHILSARKEKYGFSHIHPYTPSLLEYLFLFYQNPDMVAAFENSLREQAKLRDIHLKTPLTFQEFRNLVKLLNSNFENHLLQHLLQRIAAWEQELNLHPETNPELQAKILETKALLTETMSNEQLENMVRQGSQELGVIAIPVFNYMGAIDQYNWTDWETIDNVLDAASHAIARAREENKHRDHLTLSMKLKPEGM